MVAPEEPMKKDPDSAGRKKVYTYDDVVAAAFQLLKKDAVGKKFPEQRAQELSRLLAKSVLKGMVK